jgi:hypothetical protein
MKAHIPQSLQDEALDQAVRAARGEFADKKKWFDVPDSLIDDGESEPYYNVQAKFADIPILNVEKSRIARHNVYDLGIVLHTKVLRGEDGAPATKNATSHVMRFDKGEDTRVASFRQGPDGKEVVHYDGCAGIGKEAFEAAMRDILRCWDAWQHYQKFREAPVHPMERKAMEIIGKRPSASVGTVMVDRGDGALVAQKIDDDENLDEDEVSAPLPIKKARKAVRKAR